MARILINAVSAKHGGARTIVESFLAEAVRCKKHSYVFIAGFDTNRRLPPNIIWKYRPKTGVRAVWYNLVGAAFAFLRYRVDMLISFNNINTPLVPASRRVTYFHQLKALDPDIFERKLTIIRLYLKTARELIVLQSSGVEAEFRRMFRKKHYKLMVAWPGVNVPELKDDIFRHERRILVPIASPESHHKNFSFIAKVAKLLDPEWRIIVTAPTAPFQVIESGATNIEFIGKLSREAIYREYRKATLCLFGSTHETVGLPVFESLSVDTPVIAFDAPYVRHFRDHFGISRGLHLAQSPAEAAKAIRAIAQSPHQATIAKDDFCQSDWSKILHMIEKK